MSLVPLSLRGVAGMASSSSVASIRHDTSFLTSLESMSLASTCCGLQSPACLASLSCLASKPELAGRHSTLTRLTALSSLAPPDADGWRDEQHAHAFASMYSFHI